MKLDILCIGAHPDDVELGCAGTIAKHVGEGKLVGILDLTQGEMGTRGSIIIRQKEAEAAKITLGVAYRKILTMPDSKLELTVENKMLLAAHIRLLQPDLLLINAPTDRHPDHGKACQLALEANFIAGLSKMELHFDNILLPAWRTKGCFSYIQDQYLQPTLVIDITSCMDKKMEAIKAFKSQFFDENSIEPETPISSSDFLPFIEARSREMGRKIKKTFGEGFIAHQLPNVNSLFDIV